MRSIQRVFFPFPDRKRQPNSGGDMCGRTTRRRAVRVRRSREGLCHRVRCGTELGRARTASVRPSYMAGSLLAGLDGSTHIFNPNNRICVCLNR